MKYIIPRQSEFEQEQSPEQKEIKELKRQLETANEELETLRKFKSDTEWAQHQ